MPWTLPVIPDRNANLQADPSVRALSYRDAIREGLDLLLEQDSTAFILGEGVDDASGVFGTTLGLIDKYGKDRIVDTPLAENGMTGIAMGTAITGMKPIFVHMRPDFLILALDQLLNHAAKWCYMSNGRVPVPLTIRCIVGRGWGSAAQHSQSIQALLTHLPGLKVVMPATAHDAKGLLIAAVHDPNPVVILEHRWLYDRAGHVPAGIYSVPLGVASVCRPGGDVTLAATSLMVHEAMEAARDLAARGVEAEVVDIRSVKPLDRDTVIGSVSKTGRLVIADTGHAYGGVAAEICALVAETCPEVLRSPIKRICLPECPVPAAASLERLYFPGKDAILAAAMQAFGPPQN